jgi:Transglycosylase SLT domain
VSPAGAKGVMQIMPKTARDVFGVREDELLNARLNIQLGIDYLEQLYDQYGKRWDLALSHYNGGTLAGGPGSRAVPHTFTRKYIADVQRWQRIFADPFAARQIAFRRNARDHDSGYAPGQGSTRTQPELRRLVPRVSAADTRSKGSSQHERPWRIPPRVDQTVSAVMSADAYEWFDIERRRQLVRHGLDDFTGRDIE